jgi:hypothetical protein
LGGVCVVWTAAGDPPPPPPHPLQAITISPANAAINPFIILSRSILFAGSVSLNSVIA